MNVRVNPYRSKYPVLGRHASTKNGRQDNATQWTGAKYASQAKAQPHEAATPFLSLIVAGHVAEAKVRKEISGVQLCGLS